MSSRHVASGWRYGVSVLAMALLPAVAVHTIMALAAGLFMIVAGMFALGDPGAAFIGVGFLALSLVMLRLCWWMFCQRTVLLRTHRAILGGLLIVAALIGWGLAPADPVMHKAAVSVALLYGLYGTGLGVNAWEDKWGP